MDSAGNKKHRYYKLRTGEIYCKDCNRLVGRSVEDENFKQSIYGKPGSIKQWLVKRQTAKPDLTDAVPWDIYKWRPLRS